MECFAPDQIAVCSEHFIGGRYVKGNADTIDVKRPSDGKKTESIEGTGVAGSPRTFRQPWFLPVVGAYYRLQDWLH